MSENELTITNELNSLDSALTVSRVEAGLTLNISNPDDGGDAHFRISDCEFQKIIKWYDLERRRPKSC